MLVTGAACRRKPIDEVYRDALASFQKGDIRIAFDHSEAGLRSCGSASAWCWKFRLLKAESLIALSENQKAFQLLDGGEAPPNSDLQASRDMVAAWALFHLGKLPGASQLLEQAHHIAQNGGSRVVLAEVELRQAPLLQLSGKLDEADATLRHALQLATRAGDVYDQAQATGNLGYLFNSLSKYDEAIYWYQKSLDLAKRIGAIRLLANTVGNLGSCYYDLGDFERALANYAEAEASFARMGDLRSQGIWLGSSGAIFLENGEFSGAIDRSGRALEMARRTNDTQHMVYWLVNLAQANLEIGELDAAEGYNREAFTVAETLQAKRQSLYVRLNSARIAAGRKQFPQAEELFQSLANLSFEDPTPALEAQAGLADLYIATGEPRKAQDQFNAAIAAIEGRQTALTNIDYKISYLSSLVRFYQSYVDFLVDQNLPSRALEIVESSRARILKERATAVAAPRTLSASQLQALARSSHRTLLSYWLTAKHSYVWAISPEKMRMFTLPPEKEIRALVESYRTVINDIRDPVESHNPAGAKLSAALLGQLAEFIQPGSRVVVIPDGALHSLNFATLPAPGDPARYWIEDVTLSVAPSLDLVLDAHPRKKRPHPSLLAIGDPESPAEEFPRLPNARKEVEAIAALFPSADKAVYEGSAAQPSVYPKADPARFSFVHFAAHATANRAYPLESALILSREGKNYELTARDIMNVRLAANVVTLSSCRSAGARTYSGEGLVGLTWAFLQAGARNVIAGLWDVDDESTSALMARVYQDLTRGVPPDDALRIAQLSLLHGAKSAFHKPYYWGPFELYIGAQEQ